MKSILLFVLAFSAAYSFGQINYTVDVLRLKAKADDCDGGALTLCANAPQDPIFNLWVTDGGGNENTYCWIFEDNNDASYDTWINIQNVQVANETGVTTSYISIEMSGFETDALFSATCTAESGDDAIEARQLAQQFDLMSVPMGTPYVAIVDIAGIYFAEVQIEWIDPAAGLNELASMVSIHPNPASESLTISFNSTNTVNAIVTDLSGRDVLVSTISSGEKIDVSTIEKGVYIVSVIDPTSGSRLFVEQVLVQ